MSLEFVSRERSFFSATFVLAFSATAADWSAESHRIAIGDVNADQIDDVIAVAKDPNDYSGTAISGASGNHLTITQIWDSSYLGVPWADVHPFTGDFGGEYCQSDGCTTTCYTQDDLYLQKETDGPQTLIVVDDITGQLSSVAESIPDTNTVLKSFSEQQVVAGDQFNDDDHADLFLQPATPAESCQLVLANPTTGLLTDPPADTWADGFAGLNWSMQDSVILSGDFTGDNRNDLLVQSKGPYTANEFGIVEWIAGGPPYFNSTAWVTWSQNLLGLDWSPAAHVLHIGDFNNDNTDDIFLQPISPTGTAHIVVVGDAASIATWQVHDIAVGHLGLDWSTTGGTMAVGRFDGDGDDDIFFQAATAAGQGNHIVHFTDVGDAANFAVSLVQLTAAPTLVAPANPVNVNPVPLSGTASANATVRLYKDGIFLEQTTAAGDGSYSFSVPVLDGQTDFMVTQMGLFGESAFSNVENVQYVNNLSRNLEDPVITEDTVWTAGSGTPYLIDGNLTIQAGAELMLQPGVELQIVRSSEGLVVDGELHIAGTAASPVVLTTDNANPVVGSWEGIVINAGAGDVLIDYAEIRWADTLSISITKPRM